MFKRFRQAEATQADPSDEFVIPGFVEGFKHATDLEWGKPENAVHQKPPEAADFTISKPTELKPGDEQGPNDPLVIKGIIRLKEPEVVTEPKPAISYLSTDAKERIGDRDWPSDVSSYPRPEASPAQEERISRRLRLRQGLATLAIVGAGYAEKINARQRLSSAWSDIKNFSRDTKDETHDRSSETTKNRDISGRLKKLGTVPVGKFALVTARVLDPRPQLEKTRTPAMQDRYKKLGSAISVFAANFHPALYPQEKQTLSSGWDKTRNAYYFGLARVNNGFNNGVDYLVQEVKRYPKISASLGTVALLGLAYGAHKMGNIQPSGGHNQAAAQEHLQQNQTVFGLFPTKAPGEHSQSLFDNPFQKHIGSVKLTVSEHTAKVIHAAHQKLTYHYETVKSVNDTIWANAQEKLQAKLGHKPTASQILTLTKRFLNFNHMSWADAKNIHLGDKIKYFNKIFGH